MIENERYENIMKTAKICFIQFGYKATTVDLIAKESGIGKGTVYNYFSSKEDILIQILRFDIEGLQSLANRLMSQVPLTIHSFIEYLRFFLNHLQNGDLFKRLQVEADVYNNRNIRNHLDEMGQIAFDTLRKMVCLHIEQQNLSDSDAELSTFLILELFNSLVNTWPKNHKPLSDKQIEEIFIKLYPLI